MRHYLLSYLFVISRFCRIGVILIGISVGACSKGSENPSVIQKAPPFIKVEGSTPVDHPDFKLSGQMTLEDRP